MLKANAWHSRSDAVSSVVVMIGVGGTMAGLEYLDSVAAVLVGAMIAKIGWDLVWQSVHELVDAALAPERVDVIRQEILGVGGVRELHMLRTRMMGGEALVDVHVIVDSKLSVSEGHYIGETVRKRLIDGVDEVADVMVHVDPEDDEKMKPSLGLPGRSEIMKKLQECWTGVPMARKIDRVVLHYLDGKLDVELCFPSGASPVDQTAKEELEALCQAACQVDEVREVSAFFSSAPN
jgi:hypothetical protein